MRIIVNVASMLSQAITKIMTLRMKRIEDNQSTTGLRIERTLSDIYELYTTVSPNKRMKQSLMKQTIRNFTKFVKVL